MVDYGDSDKYAVFSHFLTRPTCLMISCFFVVCRSRSAKKLKVLEVVCIRLYTPDQ